MNKELIKSIIKKHRHLRNGEPFEGMTEFNKGKLDILSILLGELSEANNPTVAVYTKECIEYFKNKSN